MRLRILGLLPFLAISSVGAGTTEARLSKSYGELPLAFEDRGGSCVSRGTGYSLILPPRLCSACGNPP